MHARLRVYLEVPYEKKDEAKAAGARWDKDQKAWFIPPGSDAIAYLRFLPHWLAALTTSPRPVPELVLVPIECWSCGAAGSFVALLLRFPATPRDPAAFGWLDPETAYVTGGTLAQPIVEAALTSTTVPVATFKTRFSRTLKRSYMSQGCPACDALWGEVPLQHAMSEGAEDIVLLPRIALPLP